MASKDRTFEMNVAYLLPGLPVNSFKTGVALSKKDNNIHFGSFPKNKDIFGPSSFTFAYKTGPE
ncbi:MAG: hypothetical protein CMI35_04320 [Owenweeksia sp.]|nr:hypothetical protein [Owenweeksia sp.]